MDVELLWGQHIEIERLANELLSMVSHDTRQPIAQLRWQLARTLMAHLAIEDKFLYPAIIGGGDPAAARTAQRFQAEMGGLAGKFSRYMSAWSDDEVRADWPAFCRETADLLAELMSRVTRENEELYALIGDGGPRPTRLAS